MPIQTALDSISQNQGSPFGFKNRIINGAMVIDQRNAGANTTITTNNTYTLDRFTTYVSQSSKIKVGQNLNAVTPPAGFRNYLGVSSLSSFSSASSDYFLISQAVEGYNVADLDWGLPTAKTITISFWVRSSIAGTHSGGIGDGNNTRSYIFTYTINQVDTWEFKSITIPGCTDGNYWDKTNNTCVKVKFDMGSGANYRSSPGSWINADGLGSTGSVSIVGTNAANWYMTGLQLEVGKQATSFDWRPYGTELKLCQRYYYKWVPTGVDYVVTSVALSATTFYGTFTLPVIMRNEPILSTSGTASDYGGYHAGGAGVTCTAVPIIDTSNVQTPLLCFYTTNGTSGYAGIWGSKTSNGILGFNSEL